MHQLRLDFFGKWHEKGYDGDAIARVANRLLTDKSVTNGQAALLMGVRLMLRLGIESKPAVEPLAAVAFGFYQGASEALGGVKLIAA